jgi:hypothetical protein
VRTSEELSFSIQVQQAASKIDGQLGWTVMA